MTAITHDTSNHMHYVLVKIESRHRLRLTFILGCNQKRFLSVFIALIIKTTPAERY